MAVVSTYFVAKIVFLIIENFRRENAKTKFDRFLSMLEKDTKEKRK